MTAINELRLWVREELRLAGYGGSGDNWLQVGLEVSWHVHIDKSPRYPRLALEAGADLGLSAKVATANDCAVVVYPDFIPSLRDRPVFEAFDLSSSLELDVRQAIIRESVRELRSFTTERLTRQSLARSFQRGELASGFVSKEARNLLAAE